MLNGLKKEIIRVAMYNIHEGLGLGAVETITKASLTSANYFSFQKLYLLNLFAFVLSLSAFV